MSGNLPDTTQYLPPDEAKDLIAGILLNFADGGGDNLTKYLHHAGFDIGAISSTAELLPAWLGHHGIGQGTFDTDRALNDMLT
jgi:hypothetical protein